MANLADTDRSAGWLEPGRKVLWGNESGTVVVDVEREHVWVERGDGQDCFVLRGLLRGTPIVTGGKVTHPFRQGTGTLLGQFDRSDGVRMGVVEWAGYRTDNYPMSELRSA